MEALSSGIQGATRSHKEACAKTIELRNISRNLKVCGTDMNGIRGCDLVENAILSDNIISDKP